MPSTRYWNWVSGRNVTDVLKADIDINLDVARRAKDEWIICIEEPTHVLFWNRHAQYFLFFWDPDAKD